MTETPTDPPVTPDEPDTPRNPVSDELDVHNGEPLRPTFVDANGVERIAGPPVENWQPAQIDPTPEQIATNEAHHTREAARRDQTAALLTPPDAVPAAPADDNAEPDAANVTPGDSGASTITTVTSAIEQTDQQRLDSAAVAAAEADVASQVEAERALAADVQAQADNAALAAAEAQAVKDQEGQA